VLALEKEISDLVGQDREQIVDDHLKQNTKNIEHRTEALIARAQQRLSQYKSGTLPAKVAAEFRPGLDRTAGLKHRETETCPACGSVGYLEGEEVSDTEVEWEQVDEDDYDAIVTLTVEAEYFSCPTCQLVLDGYELLAQAGLSESFITDGSADDIFYEGDYGND
jgi:hypothetical protein